MAYNLLSRLKVNIVLDKKIKNYTTILGLVILSILFIVNSIKGSEFRYDTIASIASVVIFHKYYGKMGQDYFSYIVFIFTLVLHNLSLYTTSPFGIRFDHYMHFVGGFAISTISNRLFKEKSKIKRTTILIFVALGVGSLGEILEWLGYSILGAGDGFFFYGIGDEGEWRNATFDMIFNFFGAVFFTLIRFL